MNANDIVNKLLNEDDVPQVPFDMEGDEAAADHLNAILLNHFGISSIDDLDEDPDLEEVWNWAHEDINSLHPLAGGKTPQEVLDALDGVSMGLGSDIGLEALSSLKPRVQKDGQWVPYTSQTP